MRDVTSSHSRRCGFRSCIVSLEWCVVVVVVIVVVVVSFSGNTSDITEETVPLIVFDLLV
jgi:hypothetical protein